MAKRYKLREIEQERGDLNKVIPVLVNRHNGSQKEAAKELGVSQATISTFLKENGYSRVVCWVRRPVGGKS